MSSNAQTRVCSYIYIPSLLLQSEIQRYLKVKRCRTNQLLSPPANSITLNNDRIYRPYTQMYRFTTTFPPPKRNYNVINFCCHTPYYARTTVREQVFNDTVYRPLTDERNQTHVYSYIYTWALLSITHISLHNNLLQSGNAVTALYDTPYNAHTV